MTNEKHVVAFLVGAAVGGALGGLVALMNAPRPGAETWARYMERWHDIEERTAQQLANVDQQVSERVRFERPRENVG
ncbi:MAG: hypothetical protein U0031_04540 [Thermomicrobiales bacterium]